MIPIRIFTPAGTHGDPIALHEGDMLVVGRNPDLASSRVRPLVQEWSRVERLPVAQPSVSANHVLIQAERDHVVLTDLRSRNGTWVRIPADYPVKFPTDSDLQIRIGDTSASLPSGEAALPNARWTCARDFAPAIAAMTRAWLAGSQDSARIEIVADATSRPARPGTFRIPLPNDQAIDLGLTQTADPEWTQRLGQLWHHIDGQARQFEAEQAARAEGMILASEAIRSVYREVISAAIRGLRLVLMGPSGSGKELLARAYHRYSNRGGPFVAINCAELDDRVRSELFGSEPGAFTGAVKRAGAVEVANGGTLFLDEVGELPREIQAMLLRFLDRGEFVRTGDLGHLRRSEVRVVCATNRDLREEVRKERFRLDLWFRLSAQVVEIPPLHLRIQDLRAYLAERPHPGAASTWEALSHEAIEVIEKHRWDSHWGGNFRELENFAARLPDASGPRTIEGAACRRAIEVGSIAVSPSETSSSHGGASVESWTGLASMAALRSASTYIEDHGAGPADWNAVKGYIENHFKPFVFALLSGASALSSPEAARQAASKLGADRATRTKQLDRYFERFVNGGKQK